jgi:bis(5'-nucleosyl)-tetraphosphatase (symmetrical)
MAVYAIGDVQGCHDELLELLARCAFDPAHDRLWFVGDLVNRGPNSLGVLRYVRSLGRRATVVLGNHDLHLVCMFENLAKRRADDTLDEVLAAPDAGELIAWLRHRPLMHAAKGVAMVHAGLLPQWSVARARQLAREVESALRSTRYRDFLAHLYGSEPAEWHDSLQGWDRLRVIVNAMTRMRFCSPSGRLEFRAKGTDAPTGMLPWFDARRHRDSTLIVCGHWSTLGVKLEPGFAAIDSGCVWGGALSALRLDDRTLFQVRCAGYQAPAPD